MKTEVMVLRTKVKTLTDKLALKSMEGTKVVQVESQLATVSKDLDFYKSKNQKNKAEADNLRTEN